MESFFVRFKNALVLIAVLLTQTILLAVQVRSPNGPSSADGHKVLLLRSWIVAIVTPFERLSSATGELIHHGWYDYVDLRGVHRQNQDLLQQIDRLRLEQAELAEDAVQGRRLQALLAFREHYVTTTVAAQVIGTSGVDQSRILYIDKGAADGLKTDDAVITPDGIVGKVRDVFAHTAQVLEIDDPSSGAGVVLASTRLRGILRGSSDGGIQIGNLTQDSRIKPGEKVLTSGGDQIFPRGLDVGTVISIAPDPDHQPYTRIRIKSAANLAQLDEVLVITGTQPDLPAVAQQDLAVGEATALQTKRAAELAAERLPSVNTNPDGTPLAPATAPGQPADPNAPVTATVPHPLPTIHADRFTPGAAPPATSLTPGARNPAPESDAEPVPPPKAAPDTESAPNEPPAPKNDKTGDKTGQKTSPKTKEPQL